MQDIETLKRTVQEQEQRMDEIEKKLKALDHLITAKYGY